MPIGILVNLITLLAKALRCLATIFKSTPMAWVTAVEIIDTVGSMAAGAMERAGKQT